MSNNYGNPPGPGAGAPGGDPAMQGGTPGYPNQMPINYRRKNPFVTRETKWALKSTELWVYVIVVFSVLIASAVVDVSDDGQGFGASQAWWYVTLLTVGYMISRGLAKAGSSRSDHDE